MVKASREIFPARGPVQDGFQVQSFQGGREVIYQRKYATVESHFEGFDAQEPLYAGTSCVSLHRNKKFRYALTYALFISEDTVRVSCDRVPRDPANKSRTALGGRDGQAKSRKSYW